MPFRQLLVVLIALVAIVGAALFVLSWDGDDDPADEAATVTTTAPTSTASTTTAPLVVTTTSIPTDCQVEPDAGAETTTSTTTTTTAPATEGEADEPAGPRFPTLGSRSSLSTVGLDEVTFGLTVSQAEQASATEMAPCEPVSDCYRVTPVDAPEGISFLVTDGTIERVDIVAGPIETPSGIGIGATRADLEAAYGDQLEFEALDDRTTDAVFVPVDENDAEFRVAFTMVDDAVTTMRAGRLPMVLEADPCG